MQLVLDGGARPPYRCGRAGPDISGNLLRPDEAEAYHRKQRLDALRTRKVYDWLCQNRMSFRVHMASLAHNELCDNSLQQHYHDPRGKSVHSGPLLLHLLWYQSRCLAGLQRDRLELKMGGVLSNRGDDMFLLHSLADNLLVRGAYEVR